MDTLQHVAFSTLEWLSILFIVTVGSITLWLVIVFWHDKTQRESTLKRNYPVLAHFRYFFEHLGTFFRQYFFALDREEMPFNRAERSWVYRAAKNEDSTVAFGSSRDLQPAGTIFFVNHPFPALDEQALEPSPITIGTDCPHPYTTRSIFNISAMSFGALSIPAIRALSNGARQAGIWMNTGEGGLSPYHLEGGADIVFQIGTAKFGVRKPEGGFDDAKLKAMAEHEQVKMFEIKLSQGAKPGKGGILPAVKVTPEIARIRGIPVGEAAISPNRHPEIGNILDLLAMIRHVRTVTGKPTGIKFVMGDETILEALCSAIVTQGEHSAPDFITLDGGDGGSGAAPMSLIDNMGMPLRESLPLLDNALRHHGLRERIKVIASGKLINPSEVAWALCTGADFVNSARGFMFALGCIQSLQCNKNTCPTGITTHNPKLQYGLDPTSKSVRVANYALNMTKEIGIIAHSCGVAEPRQLARHHARLVDGHGKSVSLTTHYGD
ncbi:MAG: FMN-binding glutamate synthase family protein [Gammaproteobacteria bacterium]